MARKDSIKMTKEDIISSAKSMKLFGQSVQWTVNPENQTIEKRVMYFEEGKKGKQYTVVESKIIENIYEDVHMVFDCKKTMIAKRSKQGAALYYTGKGDVYNSILQRLAYNQKLKLNAKVYQMSKK
ncbi:hypothetical protein [Enterococcus wangshanyuanii]|uniref:Uncharacterized protein n=1 Tax=Enterococcus wangshanyuanii TaxID=2005703 RepID=A0ABQ1NM73_9ENTE|nr:hypothetical protein [Enterococcus wangshanyuanii]GGC79945.1 hypothetical protein GCM10011573_07030 [Enterococcus wangshanyuanii]